MYIMKGFMSMPNLADNRQDVVAPFGELPTQSMTFTRDMRNYSRTDKPDVELFSFKCIDEMLARVEPSAAFITSVLAFGQWVYQQHEAKLIPQNNNKPAFVNAITDQFPDMTAVVIGAILTGDEPDKNMPDYVQFKMLDGSRQYQLTIWFANTAFEQQYDEYEIFLIPPLPDINDLIDSKVAVNNKILELSPAYVVNGIQAIKQNKPETALISYELTWHDPSDFNAIMKTTWTAVIYGQAGADTEAIKDAIREYIGDNSTYENWDEIYPDLFSENEFVIIPMWDKYALQENALQVGLYSSMVRMKELTTETKYFLPSGYDKTINTGSYVDEYLTVGHSVYRTLSFGILGNPNNRDDVFDVLTIFPDYMALDTQDVDFVRMSTKTQNWALKLNEALDKAREYLPTDTIPVGYTRLIRRNFHYLAFEYEGYTYAVLTDYSYMREHA